MALLGEMYYKAHDSSSWYNLPRDGGVAYAAQESWVLNETIRVRVFFLKCPISYSPCQENILFGEPYDEERYKMSKSLRLLSSVNILIRLLTALSHCALERDLSLWEAGDLTEVGEKGLTLR